MLSCFFLFYIYQWPYLCVMNTHLLIANAVSLEKIKSYKLINHNSDILGGGRLASSPADM